METAIDCHFADITHEDHKAVIEIFNYYVAHSFAAYPEHHVPYEQFDQFMEMIGNLPAIAVKDEKENVIGFGFLRPYHPVPSFSHTAEITYFILPDFTDKGIGTKLLKFLQEKAAQKNISVILASISSKNDKSINFHKKNGFEECGRFRKVCQKNGEHFDVIWMEKIIG